MNNFLKRIIVGALAAVTLWLGFFIYYEKVIYLRDRVLGFYFETAETLFPSSYAVTIVNYQNYRRYYRPFRALPRGFFYAGGILLYRAERKIGIHQLAAEALRYTDYLRASQ